MDMDRDALAILLDRAGIERVIATYAIAVDTRDRARLRACFTDDLRFEMRGIGGGDRTFTDADSACDFILESVRTYAGTQHHLGTQEIAIDGDRATARTSLWAALWRREEHGAGLVFHGGGYLDVLQHTTEGWLIAERQLVIPWRHPVPGSTG